MVNRIIRALSEILIKLYNSLKRFPESLFLISISILIFIDDNHLQLVRDYLKADFARLPMVLILGFLLFLCYRMLDEKGLLKNKLLKILVWLVCAGFLILHYFLLLPNLKPISIIRFIAIAFALTMSFFFIPYLNRRKGYEIYIIKLIIGFLVTYLYAVVLFLGLATILFTIDQLFTIHMSSKLYLDIWLIVAGIFSPSYFLGGIPKIDVELDERDYSKILKILFLYIVMPILTAYTLILYAYFTKVIVTQTWPQGMVSNLVLWYSFITAAIIFLIKPLIPINLWAEKFSKIMPYVLIPLIFMCFWAMGIRIKNYGITESRYYVIVGAAWVLFTMLFWIIKKDAHNIFLLISLAIIAILTIVGPQSSFSVSLRSQSIRLENILEKNQMLKDGKIVKADKEISSEDKYEISSILSYINNMHDLKDISYLPPDFTLGKAKDTLGFEMDYNYSITNNKYYNYLIKEIQPVDISGYSFYADLTRNVKERTKLSSKDISIDYDSQKGTVTIYKQNKKIYEKDFQSFVDTLGAENSYNMELSADKLTFIDKQENIEVKYIFTMLAVQEDAKGARAFAHAEFCIFVK